MEKPKIIICHNPKGSNEAFYKSMYEYDPKSQTNKIMKKQKTTPEWKLDRVTNIARIVVIIIILTAIIIKLC